MKHLILFERFYQPSPDIKERLDELVKRLEDEYGGGRPFFDALDDNIKSITNEDITLALVKGLSNEWIASSGEFGDKLYKLWKAGKFECKGMVIFNGKMLTHRTGVNSWYPPDFTLDEKDFIYVDDSYFSGSTANKVNNFLKMYDSKVKRVFVIYDGSKEKKKGVESFFRYYQ